VCRIALIAPNISGISVAAQGDGAVEEIDRPIPLWMTFLFVAGLFTGFLLVIMAAGAFEFYFYVDNNEPVNHGAAATLLTSATWRVLEKPAAEATEPAEPPPWAKAGTVWTFRVNGKAESGKVLAEINRYDRKPAGGFRTWTWTTNGNTLTLESSNALPATKLTFEVSQDGDKVYLTHEQDAPLVLAKTEPLKTFPDLRVVFYGGIVAPMLVAFLLAWLISREVFYSGCLRFALGWPLTVLMGAALGAGAGYLLDVLNDHNHNPAPYWMMLAFAQGVLGLVTGLGLAVLSSLRPT
jgi:hypothetical protein